MTTLNDGTNWSPRLAIYGDMGSTNAQSLIRLSNETDAGHIDAILHIGKPSIKVLCIQGSCGRIFQLQSLCGTIIVLVLFMLYHTDFLGKTSWSNPVDTKLGLLSLIKVAFFLFLLQEFYHTANSLCDRHCMGLCMLFFYKHFNM